MRDLEAELVHDMRNALVVVRAAAVQLAEHGSSMNPATFTHLCELLARRSDMLVRLFNDLATAHEVGRGGLSLGLRRVPLDQLCATVVDQLLPVHDTTIEIDVPPDAVALADPIRLSQVLDNLVVNALKYGGPHVTVSAERDGDVVRVLVSDDGPGVPSRLATSLFEAYTRGDGPGGRETSGLGLGLSIVHELCAAMHGSVSYDQDRGPAFVVTLPAVPVVRSDLGHDASSLQHAVFSWRDTEDLADRVAKYAALGLCSGEAVLTVATPSHLRLIDERLVELGVDVAAAVARGQYRPLDAENLHRRLMRSSGSDDESFAQVVGSAIDGVRREWRRFRVFGEVVDLLWRAGDSDGALELESRWNELIARTPFPLLCAYELNADECPDALSACHDAVVAA